MDIRAFIDTTGKKDAQLAAEFGYDRSYWAHLRNGTRLLSVRAALKIFNKTGSRVGPIADASDDDIRALARFSTARDRTPAKGRTEDHRDSLGEG